jgi:hypothetical protein
MSVALTFIIHPAKLRFNNKWQIKFEYLALQKLGLAELQKGSEQMTALRGPLCSIVLLSYHTVITYVLGEKVYYTTPTPTPHPHCPIDGLMIEEVK